jgi:hypothetical protein
MAKRERRSGLAGLPTATIERELARRARRAATLERRRARLMAKLDRMDAQIRDMSGMMGNGGPGRGRGRVGAIPGRRRAQNKTNLAEALAAVLKGKTMSVTEVAAAVQKAGYKTNAANFRVIVNQNLIKHRNLFKKVERGMYTAA